MELGTCYLLHFDAPHPNGSRHYLGWAKDAVKRLAQHRAGRGGRATKCLVRLGISFEMVAVWMGTRATEKMLRTKQPYSDLCPKCRNEAKHED